MPICGVDRLLHWLPTPRRDSGHDMFRYSHATSNGKQFHDPSCTTLNSIIRLLSIQPNNNERRSKNNSSSSSSSRRTRMEEFKPLVYLIASFIMMYSKPFDQLKFCVVPRFNQCFYKRCPSNKLR